MESALMRLKFQKTEYKQLYPKIGC